MVRAWHLQSRSRSCTTQFPGSLAIVNRWLTASPPARSLCTRPADIGVRTPTARRHHSRRAADYFNPWIPRQTGPHFQGSVDAGRIQFTRYSDARRGSFPAWLDVRLEPAKDGGTALTGKIGESPRAARSRSYMFGGAIVVSAGILAAGAALLVAVPSSPWLR
jgi:hypothetical protein